MTQKIYQLVREGGGSDGISCGDALAVQSMQCRLIEAKNSRCVFISTSDSDTFVLWEDKRRHNLAPTHHFIYLPR